MENDLMANLVTRIFLILLASGLVTLFYNCVMADPFNLPKFTFWQITLGVISGYVVKVAWSRLQRD